MSKYTKIPLHHKDFLLTFFEQEESHYEEKEVNGYWLIKQWDGAKEMWTVNLFTNESYQNYKRGQQQYQDNQSKLDFIKNI